VFVSFLGYKMLHC